MSNVYLRGRGRAVPAWPDQNDDSSIAMHRAVPAPLVVADHTVLLRTQRFNCLLRPEIEIIRAQTHHLAAERLECMLEKQGSSLGSTGGCGARSGLPKPKRNSQSARGLWINCLATPA